MIGDALPPRTFACIECGRPRVRIAGPAACVPLCAACLVMPGWFRDPGQRAAIDPHHDGREAGLTSEVPAWP